MITHEIEFRTRYVETDQMGYIHHSNFVQYYEMGRTELMREHGLVYREIEELGMLMPVLEVNIQYKIPALYDELLRLRTRMEQLPTVKIRFDYETFNPAGQLLNLGHITLVLVDAKTRRPMRAPEPFLEKIRHHFPV